MQKSTTIHICLLSLLLTIGAGPLFADTFVGWTEHTGLYYDNVRDIEIDSQNNVWVYTYDSIDYKPGITKGCFNKYDGKYWRYYPRNNSTGSFFIDNNSNTYYWVYDDQVVSLKSPNGDTVIGTPYWHHIEIDSNNTIWIALDGMFLFQYDGSSRTAICEKNGFPDIDNATIGIDKNDVVWAKTSRDIFRFDGETWSNLTESMDLPEGRATVIDFDSNNVMWMDLNDHLYRYDGKDLIAYALPGRPKSPYSYPFYNIYYLTIDSNNVIWLILPTGTGDTLYSFDGNTFTPHTPPDAIQGHPASIGGIDKNNVLWLDFESSRLVSYDGATWTAYPELIAVRDIAVDHNNVKWVSTDNGLFSYNDGPGTTVEDEHEPQVFSMSNYPNPFNPSTTVTYTLAKPGQVTLSIYNLAGQRVAELVDEYQNAGNHVVTWQPENLAGGIYFSRVESNGSLEYGKMMFLK